MSPAVHVVLPEGVGDPLRASGGNTYDRKVCEELSLLGWQLVVHEVAGSWPEPDPQALAGLADVLDTVPTRGTVLIDGLIASVASDVVVPAAERLRVVPLVHLALGAGTADRVPPGTDLGEHEVLEAAAAVVTTSRWTRRHLLDAYGLWPGKVHVAEPGVDDAAEAVGTGEGTHLLNVAAVVPHKGQDLLVDALAQLTDLAWTAACAGALDRDPHFADDVRTAAGAAGVGDRIRWLGVLGEANLIAAYASADLLVVTSRAEAYGMVVTEALARGIPVVAADVGGVGEALGRTADGERPGLLVPPDDAPALTDALRSWLSDEAVRDRLRHAARSRRQDLRRWSWTADRIDHVLAQVTR